MIPAFRRIFLSSDRSSPRPKYIDEMLHELKSTCARVNRIMMEGSDPMKSGKDEYGINIMNNNELFYRFHFSGKILYICRFKNNVQLNPNRKTEIDDPKESAIALAKYFLLNFRFTKIEVGLPDFVEVAFLYPETPIQFLRVPDWKTGKPLAKHFQPVELAIGVLPRINARKLNDSVVDLTKLLRLETLSIGSDTKIDFEQFYKYNLKKLEVISYEKDIKLKNVVKLKELFESGDTSLVELTVVNFKNVVTIGEGELLMKQEVFGAQNGEIGHLVGYENMLRLYHGDEIEGEKLFQRV